MAEPPWLIQIIERLEYLESRAEATRRAEEAARVAAKEAKDAARRAEDLISSLSQLSPQMKGSNSVSGSEGRLKLSDDVAEELEGLKRAQKRLQDELLSKATQISSMSMAQEDAFRSLNMLSETCRQVKADGERASVEIQSIQAELRKNGTVTSRSATSSISGGPPQATDPGLAVEGLRRDLTTLQQQVTVNSSATQQVQQVQKNVGSIVDFAEKLSARQEALSKEIADIRQHLASKGSSIPVSAPKKPDPPPPLPSSTPEHASSNVAVESLRKDVEELAMAMGEVAGRFSSMEQDITQAFASCARAVDVKEIENHFISRQTALEDKVASLGKQIASIKDVHVPTASSPSSASANNHRPSEGYPDSDRGSSGSHPIMMMGGPQPQMVPTARAWGTPMASPHQSQAGVALNGMPMVPVNIMPMYPTMQAGMVPFSRAASSIHLGAMMKQGMMQGQAQAMMQGQAQMNAGRFTRVSGDGFDGPQSGASVSVPSSKAQLPSNRVMKVKPDEVLGRERMQSFSRGNPSSPRPLEEARGAAGGSQSPVSGPLVTNPPAAPFLSRLQENQRSSSDGYRSPARSSPQPGGGFQPQFLDESMVQQMQNMMGDRNSQNRH